MPSRVKAREMLFTMRRPGVSRYVLANGCSFAVRFVVEDALLRRHGDRTGSIVGGRRRAPAPGDPPRLRHGVRVRGIGGYGLGPRALEVDAAFAELEGVDADARLHDRRIHIGVDGGSVRPLARPAARGSDTKTPTSV